MLFEISFLTLINPIRGMVTAALEVRRIHKRSYLLTLMLGVIVPAQSTPHSRSLPLLGNLGTIYFPPTQEASHYSGTWERFIFL